MKKINVAKKDSSLQVSGGVSRPRTRHSRQLRAFEEYSMNLREELDWGLSLDDIFTISNHVRHPQSRE